MFGSKIAWASRQQGDRVGAGSNPLLREAEHLPPSTAEAKNQWSLSSSHTDVFTA